MGDEDDPWCGFVGSEADGSRAYRLHRNDAWGEQVVRAHGQDILDAAFELPPAGPARFFTHLDGLVMNEEIRARRVRDFREMYHPHLDFEGMDQEIANLDRSWARNAAKGDDLRLSALEGRRAHGWSRWAAELTPTSLLDRWIRFGREVRWRPDPDARGGVRIPIPVMQAMAIASGIPVLIDGYFAFVAPRDVGPARRIAWDRGIWLPSGIPEDNRWSLYGTEPATGAHPLDPLGVAALAYHSCLNAAHDRLVAEGRPTDDIVRLEWGVTNSARPAIRPRAEGLRAWAHSQHDTSSAMILADWIEEHVDADYAAGLRRAYGLIIRLGEDDEPRGGKETILH